MTDVLDSGNPFVSRSEAEAEARKERLAQVLSDWNSKRAEDADDYRVGEGDVLKISIFALENPETASELERSVANDGMINLPFVGTVLVENLTARELEARIIDVYSEGFLRNPQVAVEIVKHQSVEVVLTGAVQKPGIYYLESNASSVLEMLAKAGGLKPEASDELILVRSFEEPQESDRQAEEEKPAISLRDGIRKSESDHQSSSARPAGSDSAVVVVDLTKLIDEGDLRQNVEVRAGDILTVRPASRRYIYVLGYVARPGAFQVKSGQEIDVVRAIAMAGGLTPSARAENSYLLREGAEGQQVVSVDVTKITRGVRPPLGLVPGDTLVVGSGFFARLSEFVKPSIGAGMSYTPGVP